MAIYIYRNNQRAGPFEESAVLQWLKDGQLSADDLACPQGENEWRPLRTIFFDSSISAANQNPETAEIPPPPVAGQKSKASGRTKLLIGLSAGLIGLLVLGFIVNRAYNIFAQTRAEKARLEEGVKKDELWKKKTGEFAKLSPPEKLDQKPYLKGKGLITFTDSQNNTSTLNENMADEAFFKSSFFFYAIANLFPKNEIWIKKDDPVDEIGMIFQIKCEKGGSKGSYKSSGASGTSATTYKTRCNLAVIDQSIPAVIAKKTVETSNYTAPSLYVKEGQGEIVDDAPVSQIEDFILDFICRAKGKNLESEYNSTSRAIEVPQPEAGVASLYNNEAYIIIDEQGNVVQATLSNKKSLFGGSDNNLNAKEQSLLDTALKAKFPPKENVITKGKLGYKY